MSTSIVEKTYTKRFGFGINYKLIESLLTEKDQKSHLVFDRLWVDKDNLYFVSRGYTGNSSTYKIKISEYKSKIRDLKLESIGVSIFRK